MPEFDAREAIVDGGARKYTVAWDRSPVPLRDALGLLADDVGFRAGLIATLRAAPFAGYFWECPPTRAHSADRAFEFVLTDAPALLRVTPERSVLAEHFGKANADGIATFRNLGGDATLVVPTPRASDEAYTHLAAFVRKAPDVQVHALFQSVGRAARANLSDAPQWLSTAGMGVYWLHVRIDARPKYYRHAPYKAPP